MSRLSCFFQLSARIQELDAKIKRADERVRDADGPVRAALQRVAAEEKAVQLAQQRLANARAALGVAKEPLIQAKAAAGTKVASSGSKKAPKDYGVQKIDARAERIRKRQEEGEAAPDLFSIFKK